MSITDNRETAAQLRTPTGSSAPAKGSEEAVVDTKRVEFIKAMKLEDIIAACQAHKDKFKDIHSSIVGTYSIQQTMSDNQLAVLEEFVLQYAPEIGASEKNEESAQATN